MEYLIELDFNAPTLRHTRICINRANSGSVVFRYRIYDGAREVAYTADFYHTELVFRKPGGAVYEETGSLGAAGITCSLPDDVLAEAGTVVGYVKLIQDGTVTATLYYYFAVLSDLVNPYAVSGAYIQRLEDIISEAKTLLEAAQTGAFVPFPTFNSAMALKADTTALALKADKSTTLAGYGITDAWSQAGLPVETGTWHPTVPAGFTIVEDTTCNYYRIGGICIVELYCDVTKTGLPVATDDFVIGGLPYPVRFYGSAQFVFGTAATVFGGPVNGLISTVGIKLSNLTSPPTYIKNSGYSGGQLTMILQGFYRV